MYRNVYHQDTHTTPIAVQAAICRNVFLLDENKTVPFPVVGSDRCLGEIESRIPHHERRKSTGWQRVRCRGNDEITIVCFAADRNRRSVTMLNRAPYPGVGRLHRSGYAELHVRCKRIELSKVSLAEHLRNGFPDTKGSIFGEIWCERLSNRL